MTAWQHDLIFQVGEPGFLLAAGGQHSRWDFR